ncbi:hypothetical protein [Streptomyces racemochromogenes]|uniref:hypothetical protein n=1 Tax=Streptomyces racemochromogenes TaxID=67353 RepID=UPI0031EC3428
MTDSPTPPSEEQAEPLSAEEMAARFRAARLRRAELAEEDRVQKQIEEAMVWGLHEGRSWAEVGRILGFSGSRAEAIARRR